MKIIQKQRCSTCIEYYKKHPTIYREKNIFLHLRKNGKWTHSTKWGRIIHNKALGGS